MENVVHAGFVGPWQILLLGAVVGAVVGLVLFLIKRRS